MYNFGRCKESSEVLLKFVQNLETEIQFRSLNWF